MILIIVLALSGCDLFEQKEDIVILYTNDVASNMVEGEVGYDGVKLTQVLRPKLTTYYQNAETIGVKSIRKLVEIIEQPKFCVPEQIMVGGKIIEGGTVKDLSK